MDTPSSDNQIKKLFGGKCNVYSYDQIHLHTSLRSLLEPYGFAIILYIWKDKPSMIGHWVAIAYHNNKVIFFDSLGNDDEELLHNVNDRVAVRQHEDYPYLQNLFDQSNMDVEYNHKKLQQNNSAVCGRYACYFVRNIANYKTLADFLKQFSTNKKANDELILRLTKNYF